jgi:hypothetical protein
MIAFSGGRVKVIEIFMESNLNGNKISVFYWRAAIRA